MFLRIFSYFNDIQSSIPPFSVVGDPVPKVITQFYQKSYRFF